MTGLLICLIAASIGLSVAAPVTLAAGCSWTAASSPNPGRRSTVLYSVDGIAGDAWAVGSALNKGSPYKSLTLHNTGSGWKVVPPPNVKGNDNALSEVSFFDTGDVWAVGQTASSRKAKSLVGHWDGTKWSRVVVPASGRPVDTLSSLDATPPTDLPIDALNPTELWAVGQSSLANGSGSKALILHNDGTSWELQTAPSVSGRHGLASVVVVAADDVWAVGYSTAGDEPRPLALHFDGTAWSLVATPAAAVGLGGSSLGSITGTATDDLWAVGTQGTGIPLVMHWDGTVWSQVINVPDTADQDALTSVAMDEAGGLWVSGFSQGTGGVKTLIQTMSGGTWKTERSPNPAFFNLLVDIVPLPGGGAWAVGLKFARPQGTTLPPFKSLLLRCR